MSATSAGAEDLSTASFAGQQDTVLNVRGPDAVLEAVRQAGHRSGEIEPRSTAST
jgi:phosphoenolpyruvate synthase/pyruvate phosphate dikinase